MHHVTLEHDTLTGRRLVTIDGEERVKRRGTLVDTGDTYALDIGDDKVEVIIKATITTFEYLLRVNGQPVRDFMRGHRTTVFDVLLPDAPHVVDFDEHKAIVFVDGARVDDAVEFADEGNSRHFSVAGTEATLHTRFEDGTPSHMLEVDGRMLEPVLSLAIMKKNRSRPPPPPPPGAPGGSGDDSTVCVIC
eukprot:PLAT2208.1.p2 GENE.PLAT2208.1~~PLAT2208.1.p2  ORF type:complete len:205 (+),score=55.50 PLAT2208.1:43-615(+)